MTAVRKLRRHAVDWVRKHQLENTAVIRGLKKVEPAFYNLMVKKYRSFAVPPFYYGTGTAGKEQYAIYIRTTADAEALIRTVNGTGAPCQPHVIANASLQAMMRRRIRNDTSCAITYISFEEFAASKLPLLMLINADYEQEAEKELRTLWRKTGHNFTIYDSYAVSQTAAEHYWRRYRDAELYLYPTVLYPTLYSNWGYINDLIARLEGKPPMDILDMFAGSGVIGLSLKKETPQHRVSFCDANYWAVRSIRKTMQRFPDIKGDVWLSEGVNGLPDSAKFDLIVGNPPHANLPQNGPNDLPGADPEFEAHHVFFSKAYQHLKPGGKIVFIESATARIFEDFYSKLEKQYPQYRLGKQVLFPEYICYVQEIELA